jgi:DNA topoisomerase IB
VTARDARGRKQYRYHPHFRAHRDNSKFERMVKLSDVLATVRERVERDIALPGLPRNKVMATIVWLLERTLIRVGSHELAKGEQLVRPHDAASADTCRSTARRCGSSSAARAASSTRSP